jgi:mannosyltransferase OCH1-like enzyme
MDFDISMQKDRYRCVFEKQPICKQWYEIFKQLYEKAKPNLVPKSKQLKIPQILHFIWLGGTVPTQYQPYQQSWYIYHPSWQVIWWTDHPEQFTCNHVCTTFAEVEKQLKESRKFIVVNAANLDFDNKIFFDKSRNYGEQSDILKWEAVERFGGAYIDIDFQALAPLDDLHYAYDFYTGIQPMDTNLVQLGAALFAAVPHHPIMRACVEGIKNNQKEQQIVVKTGPIHFTRCFIRTIQKETCGITVALPASYLYPCNYEQRGTQEQLWRKPESLAVHHWAGSWLKPEAIITKK